MANQFGSAAGEGKCAQTIPNLADVSTAHGYTTHPPWTGKRSWRWAAQFERYTAQAAPSSDVAVISLVTKKAKKTKQKAKRAKQKKQQKKQQYHTQLMEDG
jgi:hypothetical protein